MNCTRCDGYGFINLEHVPEDVVEAAEGSDDFHGQIQAWIKAHDDHEAAVCDCCGDGEGWHNEPGEHNESDYGKGGPYAYNGGLPECW